MKPKAAIEGISVGFVSIALSYWALIAPATLAAISIRRKFPDAWFSGLIVWYATFVVIAVSIIIGGVACPVIYKHTARSTP
jgi:NhaP-type Na+/H+ or K+/H+ antiporter